MEKGHVLKMAIESAVLWKDRRPVLNSLELELTERCNNACIHCYNNLPRDHASAKAKELSTGDIKNILAEAASLGCLVVKMSGGEPLLREDFDELYQFARKLGLRVTIFTNATLITPRLADLFARIPPLEAIEISFYGMKKESYEAVSNTTGSFEAARRGVSLLEERGVPLVLKSALLPPNREEVDEFDAWATSVSWRHEHPANVTSLVFRARRNSPRKNKRIQALRLSPSDKFRFFARREKEYLREMKAFLSRFSGLQGDRLFFCGAGQGAACVDSYGRIQPCLLLRHPDTVQPAGKGGLKEALTKFFPEIREKRALNPEYLERCARCFLSEFCDQCPAMSWMEYGTLDTPVQHCCQTAHFLAGKLGLLRDGEKSWEVMDWKERIQKFSHGGGIDE